MRTYDEINEEIKEAVLIDDTKALRMLAQEMLELGTPKAEARASITLGIVNMITDDHQAAQEHYRHALATYEALGDRQGLASATRNIGTVFERTGNYFEALDYYNRAMAMYEELDDRKGVAMSMNGIGNVQVRIGTYPTALENYRQVLAINEELDNRDGMAAATGNIGLIHNNTGDLSLALEYWHRALALYDELGDPSGVAVITGNIGNLYSTSGDHPKALEYYYRALATYKDLGRRSSVAHIKRSLGWLYIETGDYPRALELFHDALALSEELADRDGIASVLSNIGQIDYRVGDYSNALEHFQRALNISNELGSQPGVAADTLHIGNVHNATGNYPLALECYNRALAIFTEQDNKGKVALCYSNILEVLVKSEDFANAEALIETIDAMQIQNIWVEVEREQHRASIQEHNNKLDDAMQTLRSALVTSQKHTFPALQVSVHRQLRDLCQKRNDFAGYIEHNNEFTRINDEINGKDTATKLAMQAKQREIDAERKETEKHMAVLHSTLPKHIADRVARGEVVNDHIDNAAVMFIDIVGFTTLSSSLTSQQVITLLDGVFKICDGACAQHNVTRIKTIGDSYLAVAFGEMPNAERQMPDKMPNAERQIPNQLSNAVEAISKAAMLIVARIKETDFKSLQSLQAPSMSSISSSDFDISKQLQVRIGLHCGPVTAGVLGNERLQYDVWGDTVNVASRMESTSEPNRIHISDAFAKAVAAQGMLVTERGAVELKGKGMMTTYWL